MLVIRRRAGEALVIGEDIEVEILETSGSYVKLGIRAPKSIPVARKELHVVGQQNQAASSTISPLSVIQLLERLKNPSSNPISGL
jgi:carbon storage regulator